jgi:hypothetical protein
MIGRQPNIGIFALFLLSIVHAFQPPQGSGRIIFDNGQQSLRAEKDDGDTSRMEYRNAATNLLSNFMKKEDETISTDALSKIDFSAPKFQKKVSLEVLAQLLDAELYEREWFVTGNVNPIYFSENFVFQDPDVRLDGIEAYARGVNKLFDQETSRAEIISTTVNPDVPNTITCTWRLSGKANIGPGLTIKPYIVYTDLKIDPESGLIVFQEDRFNLPQWDILLSSLFPFLIGVVTAPPAPLVEPRTVIKPVIKEDISWPKLKFFL